MSRENVITLGTIANGAAVERFEDALRKLLENVADPNTAADATRKITLTFEFVPNDERKLMDIKVSCTSKLAGPRDLKTMGYIGTEKGEPIVTEFNPEQGNLFDAKKEGHIV